MRVEVGPRPLEGCAEPAAPPHSAVRNGSAKEVHETRRQAASSARDEFRLAACSPPEA